MARDLKLLIPSTAVTVRRFCPVFSLVSQHRVHEAIFQGRFSPSDTHQCALNHLILHLQAACCYPGGCTLCRFDSSGRRRKIRTNASILTTQQRAAIAADAGLDVMNLTGI